MAAKPLDDEVLLATLAALEKHGTIAASSRAMGIPRSTFEHRIRLAQERELENRTNDEPILPTFPPSDLPTEQLIQSLSARFEKRIEHQNAKRYFDIVLPDDRPRLLATVGDPHLGVSTNWKLLQHHVELMTHNEGVMCVGIGDAANNWGGRLTALYAEEDISRETERRLAKWFLEALPWAVWLHGNHEAMNSEFSTYLEAINAQKVPMIDWRATVRFVFPSATIKADFAHNHKGSSIYSKTMGQKRSVLWEANPGPDGAPVDLVVAGHHHTWAITQEELDDNRCVILARCRGYKFHDTFAIRHQFANMRYGSTLAFVVQPKLEGPMRITPFADLEQGIKYLKFLRSEI